MSILVALATGLFSLAVRVVTAAVLIVFFTLYALVAALLGPFVLAAYEATQLPRHLRALARVARGVWAWLWLAVRAALRPGSSPGH